MANIENIFKNQIYFQGIHDNSVDHEGVPFIIKTLLYRTMLIQNPQSMWLDNIDDIYRRVEPFIHYLASEHKTMEPEGSKYVDSSFDTGNFTRDVEKYKKLAEVNIYYDDWDDFHFREPEYLEIGPYATYTKPFEIHIDAYAGFNMKRKKSMK